MAFNNFYLIPKKKKKEKLLMPFGIIITCKIYKFMKD